MPIVNPAFPLIVGADVLALIGMGGVFRIPLQVFRAARNFADDRRNTPVVVAWLLLILTTAPLLVSFAIGSGALPCALRNLEGGHCNASRAGALLELSIFGLTVLVVEATALAASVVRRHLRREASA